MPGEVIDMVTGMESLPAAGHAAFGAKQSTLPASLAGLRISGLWMVEQSRELSVRNKELIYRFLEHIAPEVSERRLTFYTHKLRKIASWLQRDFESVSEDDLRSLVTYLSKGSAREDGGKYSLGSVHGYKVTLKRFYRWLEGNDEEYPRKVRWIKTSGDATRIKEPEQLLTFEEVLRMIRCARNPRDKAMVSFLYESGARMSELLSMRIRHLEFTPTVVKATLPVSKTRPRVIPLVSCSRHLATWLNYHPAKDDPDAPIWADPKHGGGPALKSQTVNGILKQMAAEAGIRKRVYPHLFRACSITHKQAAGWPEQAIKAFHGLCKDSKVMKYYSHLSYANLEDVQRKMNGLPVENAAEQSNSVRCSGCGRRNPLYVETCECGLPTEMRAAPCSHGIPESEMERRLEQKMEAFIEERMTYDRMMERFLKALAEKAARSPEILKAIAEIGSASEAQSGEGHPPSWGD